MDMSRRLQLLFLAALTAVAAGCGRGDNGGRQPQPSDTLYTKEAAMAIYAREPERALLIIDSAEVIGNIGASDATYLRARVYSRSGAMWSLDTATQMLESLITVDSIYKNPLKREMVLDMLVYVSRMRHDNARCLRWATEKADFCRERGLATEALRTEADIGYLLCQMGDEEDGLAKLDGVIASLYGRRHFSEMDACIIALKRKANIFSSIDRHAEIVPLAHRIMNIVDDYRRHPAEYADSSDRIPPNDEEFRRYCEFYTAQACCYLAYAYSQMDQPDSARRYLDLFSRSDCAQSVYGKMNSAQIYGNLGQYDKMLALYDEVFSQHDADTLNDDYIAMLYGRACAAEAVGDYRKANSYLHRCNKLNDETFKRMLKSRAYQYAARYRLKEEQLNAEQARVNARHNLYLAVGGFSLALVFCLFVLWLLGQRRAIRRKDRVLVEQIAEAMKYKEIADRLGNEKSDAACRADASPDPDASPDAMTDEELYLFLCDAIRTGKFYLDPAFGRQSLVDRYHITDRRIGAAFAHGNGLPDYVRELRLDHACRLLAERPDMSIGDIGAASGFSNLSVFSREFKRKFDVAPTYYRTEMLHNA